jgi:phage major head subunit gpT-like protein
MDGDIIELTRELPKGLMSAELVPASLNEEDNTIDVVWSTGMRGLRYDYEIGRYYEELSLDPLHVKLDRLNQGASVLNSHQSFDLENVLGAVVRNSASVNGSEGVCKSQLSERESIAGIIADIKKGIIRHISIGYNVYRYVLVETGENELPVYRAVDWEPMEISFVPVPFDYNSQTRTQDKVTANACVFVNRGQVATQSKETIMSEVAKEGGNQPVADPQEVENARLAGVQAERTRVSEIRKAVEVLPVEIRTVKAEEFINSDVSADQVRASVIDLLAKETSKTEIRGATLPNIQVGEDLSVKALRTGIENALAHRSNSAVELKEEGRLYRGYSLIEMAREYAEKVLKVDTRGMNKMEIAGLALGNTRAGGMHTTSDFPILLANVANKTLRDGYAIAAQTWRPLARQSNFNDFKLRTRAQFGEAPSLRKVNEGGEITYGTIGEGRETYQLTTFARIINVSRQTLVNDDLDAFSRVPSMFGASASRLESDQVWAQITSNPTMGDGTTLFHSTHGNVAASAGAIAIATIGAGRTAMRQQKGLDKADFLNLPAQYLVVPSALETIADQFVSTNMVANQNSNVNPFAGRLQVISEPRLDAASTSAWYLASNPANIDMIEFGYLDGAEGPQLETRMGFEVDGMEIKCRLDFAAKVIDWRGFYRNA